jgi:hypothetical protein
LKISTGENAVMNTTRLPKGVFVPIQEAAKVDPEVAKILHDIESGNVDICFPCAAMYAPWTEDEKQRFKQVAADMAKRLMEKQLEDSKKR